MFNRRRFLQGAAGALGAIGLSPNTLSQQANTYGRALAQSTPRKVALLVGINDYTRNSLGGAVNDVELQRKLLIHRFGFNPADVHVLKEQQASRRNILGAFDEYLYQPAKAGDVVVFHFSGHGDRVRTSDLMPEFTRQPGRNCLGIGREKECFNTAIAPFDHDRNGDENGTDTVQDIMGHTLLLMRAALAEKTENVTFVMDCCYAGGGKRGNAIMRSLSLSIGESLSLSQPNPNQSTNPITRIIPRIADTEWETQRQWLDRLSWSENDFANAMTAANGPGFFIGSAKSYQLAADYSFDGFIAGAFTYLLTQHLWQATGPNSLAETILNVTNSSTRLNEHSQIPEYDPQPSANRRATQSPIYHIESVSPPAEALILDSADISNTDAAISTEDSISLWLGGLDPQRLEAFDRGAIFSVIDRQTGDAIADIQQIENTREGLITQGQLVHNRRGLDPADLSGQLLQERTRGIPDQVVLKIALDDTLTHTEQQYVMATFGRSPDFEIRPVEPGKSAHILLGRHTQEIDNYLANGDFSTTVNPTLNSIGIFSPSQVPMLTGSFGPAHETIEAAIDRLTSRFISLHIGRMLALMVNGRTSQIDVSVEVEHLGSRSGAATRGSDSATILIPQQSARGIEQVPENNLISVTIKNNQPEDLHFGLLVIDSAGEVNVLFPAVSDDSGLDIIKANGSKTESLRAVRPFGIAELLVLASPQSLFGPLATLSRNAPHFENPRRRGTEISATDVMSDLFSAMDTRRGEPSADIIEGTRLLDVEDVAVLSLLFEIQP